MTEQAGMSCSTSENGRIRDWVAIGAGGSL